MDKLFIRGLQILARVGILPHEKEAPQMIVVDITYGVDVMRASASDDVGDTVDYAEIRENILEFLAQRHFNLIETLADQCANFLLAQFASIQWLRLQVTKPSVFKDAAGAGIIVERNSRLILK